MTPTPTADLIARLREAGARFAAATQALAADRAVRRGGIYQHLSPEQTLEWQAADALERAEREREDAAREAFILHMQERNLREAAEARADSLEREVQEALQLAEGYSTLKDMAAACIEGAALAAENARLRAALEAAMQTFDAMYEHVRAALAAKEPT